MPPHSPQLPHRALPALALAACLLTQPIQAGLVKVEKSSHVLVQAETSAVNRWRQESELLPANAIPELERQAEQG